MTVAAIAPTYLANDILPFKTSRKQQQVITHNLTSATDTGLKINQTPEISDQKDDHW